MNSQSALRAEADSDDDSELSLSLFREGSERTSFFWPNQKVYKSNKDKLNHVALQTKPHLFISIKTAHFSDQTVSFVRGAVRLIDFLVWPKETGSF